MADEKGNQTTDTTEDLGARQQSNFFRLENPGREDAWPVR